MSDFYISGKHMKLSPEAEEVATFFAKMLDHEYTTKDIFRKNFFKDWRKVSLKSLLLLIIKKIKYIDIDISIDIDIKKICSLIYFSFFFQIFLDTGNDFRRKG